MKELKAELRLAQLGGDASPFTLEVTGTIGYRDLRNATQSVAYRARLRATTADGGLTCSAVEDEFGA